MSGIIRYSREFLINHFNVYTIFDKEDNTYLMMTHGDGELEFLERWTMDVKKAGNFILFRPILPLILKIMKFIYHKDFKIKRFCIVKLANLDDYQQVLS